MINCSRNKFFFSKSVTKYIYSSLKKKNNETKSLSRINKLTPHYSSQGRRIRNHLYLFAKLSNIKRKIPAHISSTIFTNCSIAGYMTYLHLIGQEHENASVVHLLYGWHHQPVYRLENVRKVPQSR